MSEDTEYKQLYIWEGIILTDDKEMPTEENINNFLNYLENNLGGRFKYCGYVITLPDKDKNGNLIPETGGRSDQFFYIHNDDVNRVARLKMGIHYWEDVLGNGHAERYPIEVLKTLKPTWNGRAIRENNPSFYDLFRDVPD